MPRASISRSSFQVLLGSSEYHTVARLPAYSPSATSQVNWICGLPALLVLASALRMVRS